jgi:hypothetical protein
VNQSGEFKALKIIQIDNLEKGPQLDSFRRGVKALSYLSAAKVPGTANLEAAFEIPTAEVMEFIDGDNLTDLVPSGSTLTPVSRAGPFR